jgi:chromosome segregation ATPase
MTDIRHTSAKEGLGTQLWGTLRNALTQDDPVAAARRGKLQRARPADNAPAAASTPPQPLSSVAGTLLAQVLSKATAYTALTDKLAPLEPIIADERTRYQAAYALIRSSRSVEQIVQSIELQHMQSVDAEVARFAAQLEDRQRREIVAREQEAKNLAAGIDASTQQVARLRQEHEERVQQIESGVAAQRERLAQLNQELQSRQHDLASVQRQFDAAVGQVKDALAAAKAKVLGHLG